VSVESTTKTETAGIVSFLPCRSRFITVSFLIRHFILCTRKSAYIPTQYTLSCIQHRSFIVTVDTKGTKNARQNQQSVSLRHSKGEAIPLQALTGPEGSRGLRLSDFKTFDT
jgi:hypothetical protein